MKDTREKALEKARQRAEGNSSSSSFESERQRAAQARRDEVSSYTGQNVHMIPAVGANGDDGRILRVAAYCRVSTDDIDQVISIELQKDNYRDKIRENPKWKYVGTYVDDGFSGTNTEHRPGFTKMMKDAMDGKIDLIITKAVSRFARNLIDCIDWVRRLQKRDSPVAVYFEQENLNTLAVRPCKSTHPNAIQWTGEKKKCCSFGSTVLSKLIFEMLEWNEDCSYKIPASVREKDGERILFFDLENVIANKSKNSKTVEELQRQLRESEISYATADNDDDDANGNFFFAAEEDEPQSAEDVAAIEQRLLEILALEKVTFGTPLRAYSESRKLSAIDEGGVWDVMATARALDSDHSVDEETVRQIEDRLLTNTTLQ